MKFAPSEAMIRCAETVFAAMAMLETIRPIVTGYQSGILLEGQWKVRPEWAGRCGSKVILDPNLSYLMSEADFADYDARCKTARKASGLRVEDEDNCPLCVAEHFLVLAQHALIDAMSETTKITTDKIVCADSEKYKQYVDLTLRLLAPFVNPKLADELLVANINLGKERNGDDARPAH